MLEKSKYLSEKEQKQLIDYLKSMKRKGGKRDIQRWLLVVVGLNTGLRVSEICDLQLSDLDLQQEFPSIKVNTRKGGDNRNIVYISHRLAKDLKWYLKHHANGSPYLFTTERNKKQTPTGLYLMFQTALQKAGLQRYPLHSLRHSFAVNVYGKSKDLRLTQKQMRHRSIQSTCIYADVTPEQICKTMNEI